MLDIHDLAEKIAGILGHHAGDIKLMVRDREAYIDGLAPTGKHDPDFVKPDFKKIEITIKVT